MAPSINCCGCSTLPPPTPLTRRLGAMDKIKAFDQRCAEAPPPRAAGRWLGAPCSACDGQRGTPILPRLPPVSGANHARLRACVCRVKTGEVAELKKKLKRFNIFAGTMLGIVAGTHFSHSLPPELAMSLLHLPCALHRYSWGCVCGPRHYRLVASNKLYLPAYDVRVLHVLRPTDPNVRALQ